METHDDKKLNLVEQAEEFFNLHPEYLLDLEKAMKEYPFLVLKYRAVLSSIANALIFGNATRFNKSMAAYKSVYNKFIRLELFHNE